MSIVVTKNNVNLKEFIKENEEKIKEATINSPSISKDDEWINETEWDDLFLELAKERRE